MKVSYIVPARNKEKHVRRCVESVLAQTHACEILLSDQGSTDYTRQILSQIAAQYRGQHMVRLLECPITDRQGMVGMNVHINWLMEQTDADVVLLTSADDFTMPDRVAATVKAYEQFKPSMVLTGMHFTGPDLVSDGVNAYPAVDGWVTPDECLKHRVGGSTSISWSREFWNKIGPLPGIPGQDVFMPFLATLDRGAYYLNDKLHCYVKYADADNTGLEGAWRAADQQGQWQLEELMHFQVTTAYYSILTVMHRNGWHNEEAKAAIFEQILDRSASWVSIRQQLSLNRIPPLPFRT